MRYRKLGATGLTVSEIGFGCASFWGKALFDEREAIRLVHEAHARGITFFDTGSSYSGGNAEPRLGRALASLPNRHDLIVATKAGTRPDPKGRLYSDMSPAWIRESVEKSLKRLGLDQLPLLQLHGPVLEQLTDDLFAALEVLRKEGKVKHFSINSFDAPVIQKMIDMPVFGAVMLDYNILRPGRESLITALAQKGIGILAGMALAGGLYSSRLAHITRPRDVWYALRAFKNHRKDMKAGAHFRFIEREKGWTGAQIALAWVLRNPDISSAVIGTTRATHLFDAVAASGRSLDQELTAKIASAQKKLAG